MPAILNAKLLNNIRRVSLACGLLLIGSLVHSQAQPQEQAQIQTQPKTSLWKVEKDGGYLYLGGTVHALTDADYPLPRAYDQAYADADILYFETDIGQVSSPAFLATSTFALSYSDGRTLQSVLRPEVYAQVSEYFSARGVPMFLMSRVTAGGASMAITVLELQNLGYDTSGVDQYYYERAAIDGKRIGVFESVDEQLAFIAGLGEGIENEIMLAALADVARSKNVLETMTNQWRTGDMDGLYLTMIVEFKERFPSVYESLIASRNNAWMSTIEAMFQTEEVELVLVGAGHMAGTEGILKMLEAKGYKTTQF